MNAQSYDNALELKHCQPAVDEAAGNGDEKKVLVAVATAPDGMVTLTVFEGDIAASVDLAQDAARQIAGLLNHHLDLLALEGVRA